MKHHKAFTLTELLVVISIIAVLATIALPNLLRAAELARRAVCANNLSSIAKAMTDYATAYDNWYPSLYVEDHEGQAGVGAGMGNPDYAYKGNSCNMYVLIRLEMISQAAFICPSTEHDVNPLGNPSGTPPDDDFRHYENLSYSFHAQRAGHTSKIARPISTISPSGMAMLADRTPISGNDCWADSGAGWYYGAPEAMPGLPEGGLDKYKQNSFNHNQDGQNVVFLNSSCRFVTTPRVGVNEDNIWSWAAPGETPDAEGRRWGAVDQGTIGDKLRLASPANDSDSMLFP